MIDQKIVRNYASCLFSNVKSDLEHQKVLDQISFLSQLEFHLNFLCELLRILLKKFVLQLQYLQE